MLLEAFPGETFGRVLPGAVRARSKACESSSPFRVRVVAERPRAGGSRGSGRASSQAPVVDTDHVLGPCPSREAVPLVEADQPVVGVFFAHHEEHLVLLTNGEFSVYLRIRWEVRLQLKPDLDLAVLGDHLVGAEGDLREGEAPPSGDMVLEAVPGAGDDLTVVDPFELPGVLLSGDEGAQRRFAPTQRPRLVRADVGQPQVLAPDVEHPDLAPPDL